MTDPKWGFYNVQHWITTSERDIEDAGQSPGVALVRLIAYGRIEGMRVDNRTITSKQSAFADEWIRNGNDAKAAYRLVYAVNPKVTDNSLYVQSSRLLANSKVALRISQQTRALAKRVDITLDDTVQLQWGIAKDNEQPGHVRSQAGMNAAKLLGYLIERKEIHTTTDKEEAELREGLRDGLFSMDQLRAQIALAPIIDVTPPEALPEPRRGD